MTLRVRPLTLLLTHAAAVVAACVALAPAADAAAAAPSALTGPLSALAATTVTLTGTVNPNGASTTWLFDYGTVSTFGSSTTAQSAGSGTTDTSVSSVLTGLTPDTFYYFRLTATNSSGTTDGSSGVFMTVAASNAVTSAATTLTATSATLNGAVNPGGVTSTYSFQYGTTAAYGQVTPTLSAGAGTTAVEETAAITGLSPGTTYHYRVVLTAGTATSFGSDETFTTVGGVAPQAQTGSAEAPGATTVTLTASIDPEGAATSWEFQYGKTSAYGLTTVAQPTAAGKTAVSVTAALTNLTPDSTYHYRIVATNATATTDGEDVTFTTPPAVTLLATGLDTVDGRDVSLSGVVAGAKAGARVSVLAQPAGNSAFVAVATVSTTANGSWTYRATPTITTAYRASAAAGVSQTVTIDVSPAITIRRITRARLLIQVIASSSLDGKTVILQRLSSGGRWRTVRSAALGTRGSAVISQSVLPSGASTIRIEMNAKEAGAGYVAGFSRTLVGVAR